MLRHNSKQTKSLGQAIFKDFGGGRRKEALTPTLFHVYESESGRHVKRESSTATSPNTTIKQAALSTGTLLRGLLTVPTTLNELHSEADFLT